MDSSIEIRRLAESDAEALWRLRLRALQLEPQAFAESVDEHQSTSVTIFAERLRSASNENFVLGALASAAIDGSPRDGSALVGMAGFFRGRHLKHRHKGTVWGVFVVPEHRGKGIGRKLIEELVSIARTIPDLRVLGLTVTSVQQSARSLYTSCGFRSFGVEPLAVEVNGEFLEEEHMVLLL